MTFPMTGTCDDTVGDDASFSGSSIIDPTPLQLQSLLDFPSPSVPRSMI
eukprot:CAMPEP_0181126948 /NCGR_PEP_ID=MMETSP1071-20121207/27921_1 /TAXON_ID=35127 /ORGANISM="Thalassiosira sp., Strain NH16" /LENGTH=48 /DNA_ID= /DNA_START= /DNA_END= /DNA_ORIENTATION=